MEDMHVITFSSGDDLNPMSPMKLVWASESLTTVFSKPWQVTSGRCNTWKQISSHMPTQGATPATSQEFQMEVDCTEVKVEERLPRMCKS